MDKSERSEIIAEDADIIDQDKIFEEAKQCFMSTSVKTKRLVETLTRCLFVLLQGDSLEPTQATDIFFHITRLFQYRERDGTLRRLTYIAMKILSKQAENVYVVKPSLISDIQNSPEDSTVRAAALRALSRVTDSFKTIEPHLRQSLIDENCTVVSAALSSLILKGSLASDTVARLESELKHVMCSDSPMVQYHTIGLLYKFCDNNQEDISNLINNYINRTLKSPLAICLVIRIIANFLNFSDSKQNTIGYYEYIKINLKHQSEMVQYEAAHAIINLKSISNDNIENKTAVAKLRNFLTSSKAALRHASVRSLNELAMSSSVDIRFWSIHRIGGVCKLHLLNKRYRIGDHIVGILDFSNSSIACAKYTVILQCEETQQYELKQEFSLGLKKNDFMITIPLVDTEASVLHCVLSFLFYIVDKNYPKTLFEDKAGTIELGPNELETKLFSCDFPIAIHT